MHALEDVISELLLEVGLLIKLNAQVCHFISQSLLPHSKIINNEGEVLIDSVEVLELSSHFVCLIVKLLDFHLSRADVSL
jgi:hypothetical protein